MTAANEVNAKPQVTEITNGSHVQSDATNAVKSDASTAANTQSDAANIPANVVANANTNVSANTAANMNVNIAASANTNANAQSQNDQNHANASQPMRVMRVASRAGSNVSPNAVSASLAESTEDSVMQQAVQQSSTLRDDRSTDYTGYIKGQAKSVTLKDGSSLSVNSDMINSDANQSAILTFKSASFKPGDTYTILIPYVMMQKQSDVAHLQPSFGTTTVSAVLNNGKRYWKIINHFVNSGTVSQDIKLSRNVYTGNQYLSDYFSNADYWRPYDLIHGTINVIKGVDHGSLDFKYQLSGLGKQATAYYGLTNGDLNYPVINGQAYDFNIELSTEDLIEYGERDGFGLSKDVLKNVSFSIDNTQGYLKLNTSTANIYDTRRQQLLGTMSVKSDHGKFIFSDLKFNDTARVIGSLVSPLGVGDLYITFNTTVDVPKQLFNGKTFAFPSIADSLSLTFNNPKVDSVKSNKPVANIKVLPDLTDVSTGNLIAYVHNHHYLDLGASAYRDHRTRITKATIDHDDDIPGVRRYSGFFAEPMHLTVNGLTLSNLNYHLDIPDGFDLYSVNFNFIDHITSAIIRLKDGTSYEFSPDDLRPYYDDINKRTMVTLNHSIYNNLSIDSDSSIVSVDIKYHDVDSSVDIGPYYVSNYSSSSSYRIAPTYASGKPVQVGDLLTFTATLSSTDPHVKIDSAPIILDDVLITDPNKDTLRVYHEISSMQSNKTPGVVNAGNLIYRDANLSSYGFPHLTHAVAYLQIPDNASLTDIKKIAVTGGLNSEYGKLTPKSISLVQVANGVTFIKVDLSNYNDIRAGVDISVLYGNVGDLQTSSRPSSMLVVSDNFDQDVKGIRHFASDTDSRTDTAVKALIDQEHINVNKTDYQGSTGANSSWWDILTSDGMTSATMTKGNVNSGPSMDSKQNDHTAQADRFDLYGSTINATDQSIPGAVQIINVPSTSDGHSQFNPQLTGPIHVIDANTGKNLDAIAHVTYSQSPATLRSDSLTSVANGIRLAASQVTDWSKIKSIAIRMDVPKRTSARAVLSMKDPQVYDHVGKTIYVANAIFSTQSNSPTGEYHLKPVVINAGDPASAKLAVTGQSTVKTMVHYHDAQGDHYVELPDKARTYNELHDVMNRSDFPQSDTDLTAADRALLPAGMVLDYAHPKIKNSNETYLNNYQNGTATFGQQVKYNFDQDQVIFEGAMPTQTSDTKTVTETIHYVYANGPKAGQKASNDVTKSVEFSRSGFKNPFTGDVQWMKSTSSKTFDAVESPDIKGYRADQREISTQTVTQDSNNIEKTVKYMSQQQKMTINYIDDDAAGKVLHTDVKTGLSNETADYTTANEINTLKGQHYVLVSDDTKGQKPVYDDDVDRDQVFNVHVKHATRSISDSRTVTETVHYQAADGSQVPSDHVVNTNFTRTGTHDEVTGADRWNAWNVASHNFDAVPTPAKTGYTPDIRTVAAETVTPGSSNIRKVVTYTPDAQKLSVKFIDDTTGQVLKTVAKTGVTNANAGYNTQSDIQHYVGQHYVLVSDSSHGVNLVFDNNDSVDQAYEVHLKHGTHQIDEHHTITQTVHYIATDHASVPDDHTVSVQFDRDGYHDEVTGDDHWNAWKQGSIQTFTEVPTPKKAGYTPDKSSVPATVVHPSDHNQAITVTYTPDTQKVIVTFIDDTDGGKTLKTVTKTGPTNSSAGYTTGGDINMYKGQHYVLVSDQTHGQNITFDTDTNTDQRYEVHLKHGTHQINDHRTITETVYYKMADGTTAPADHTVKAEFSRDGFNDEVTGADHWNAWTPSATRQFDAVQSPVVKGYTPDVDQIPAVNVNPDSKNIERTVTYSPDAQKLDVTFIDDTTGTTLKTVVKNGVTHTDAKYNTQADIHSYENQHYVLVSDSSKGAALVFDNDDAVDQHYVVHLKHNTHAISEHHTVNETVRYQMSDGTKAPADYQAKALSFSRDGFNDEVTGIDHWNAWTPSATQQFDTVHSPLVAGYTPDSDQIAAQTVKPTDHDLAFTVTYTPNVQIAHIKYIDDTDHKVLTQDDLNGRTGETSGYHTADRITEFKRQHYVFVSDNYPAEGMTFDNHDRIDQTYEVHFKHATRTDEQDVQVPRTIKYVYQNGRPAQPDHTDALSFHETKVVDLVDGHTVSDDWTPAQDFKTIETPAIQGYTPDHASITNTGIAHDHPAIVETVTYNPDAQKAVVKYIDDTTGKQLEAKDLTGVSDQSTGYNTKSTIDGYVNQHYVLVSDGTHGETVVFDHNDDADQAYEVHLKHGTEPANESRIKKITVHYQYADGLARSGKAADDKTATNLTYKRTGTHDLVTDKIAWNAWDHADQTFAAIDSPAIQGYTPDRTVVDSIKVNPDSHDLTDVTVTYNADSQKLSVDFIDDTTGKTLKTVNKIGYSDESADYNTKADIQDLISKHYDLTSDQTNGENLVFDHDDNTNQHYEVHLSHHTHQINEQHTVTETVHYQYADGLARSGKAADDFNAASLNFSRDGFNDEVTGVDHWNTWTPADHQSFAAVQSPVIEGYTPDQSEISMIKVVPTSQSIEKTVTYTADAQTLSVDFIDDTTGQTLKTVNKTGYSDESVGYNTKADIQTFAGQHYDLVSDTTKGADLVFDHDDSSDQHYEVHLSHHTHQINEHHTVTETVHYQYADGLARSGKAADDFNATPLSFSRDGFNDEVTGVDHWNAWTPADQQSFAVVQSPVIEGYTPDQSEIGVINVVSTSRSIDKTVTYTADAQKLTVNFIDDVTGQTLKTVAKTGYSDGDAGYNSKADIQNFVGQHYDLVSDATKGADLVFDHDDVADQEYDVHLTHHLTPISDHQVVNETIHYVYADGLARTGKAADDYVATPLEFNRTGKHDDVTGTDAWDAWIPGSASFAAVQSPAIQGYTPDQSQVDAVSVNANSQDIVKTVTYSADPQTVTIDFIDDTDHGKVLKTVTKTGGSDEAVGYSTKADIQTFVDGHYKLDHDTSNGANLFFDHDDAVDQHYEVHLTHETAPISEATSTNQVIHYQLADGTPVTTDYTAKVDFSRDGFEDLVTNADHWNAWTPNATQTFDAVVSPAKAGYTPDHAQVDAVTVEPHHANLETTVTYSPDPQKATVEYVDDTTGKTLQTKELTGVSDETSTYMTVSTIKQYVGQHYKLVSDQTNGKPVVFDHNDGSDQTFVVHLTHTYQEVSQEHRVHQTIHYCYADGKQVRPDYTAKAITFSRTGTQDLVTENIQWNAWTPDQVFAAVDTPAVNGYTPDVQTVAPVTVSHNSHDIVQTVVYHADDQTILVNYIDDETHSTLKTDSIIGKTAQTSDYTTKKSLDKYKSQHYDVVSDDTNGDTLKFDSDSTKVQTYNVHLKHQHQAASDKSTVRQTVHYVYQDGKQAAKDHAAAPIEFTRTGDTDLVTGKTTWNAWTPATGTFTAVVSPSIEGYTPSRVMIEHVNVHPGDKDLDTTVTYVPDRQVIVVNYIDQTTGKTLKTDTLNGHSDQTSGYTTKSQIDSYVGQHYKLISDDTHGRTLTFDHNDQATQTYDVVLGHQTETAHRTHEVHETVDYVYADGSQAAKSFTAQPLVFSQTGVHDLVTNTTDWNGEWTKPQAFAAVESPKIIGFTASKPEVKAVNVDHKSGDVHELVIYAANAQTAQIKYIDDVTGKTLETDGANGHFNESIVFGRNVNDQINKFKQAHYKLVSNNFAGQKYQADNDKNVYEVHLTHERQNVHAADTVTETVKFQYADGSQAQPTQTQAVNFGRDGIKDLVTGTTAWMPVDPQVIGAVNVPVLDGYTADTDQVPAVKVNFGDNDMTKVVTYTANDQTAGIKIIDDTTGKVLNTQSATGKFGTEIQFKQNPDQQVIDLQAQHYELVSDNFKHQAYKSDNTKNQFEIHVRHQTADTQRTDAVTETVHYRDNHGNQLRPDTQVTKTFTQSGVIDKVTGDIAWNPVASQMIDQVTAPEITGYTPDRNSVPAATVNFGDNDIDQIIVYTPVREPASIKYVDDVTGKTLLTDHTTGDFGTQINFDHDPLAQIGQYESQGYKLVSNSYGNNAHQFSAIASENNFEVHLTHGTKDAVQTSAVNRVINYVDSATGENLRPSTTQTLTFTEHGTTDEVTGKTTWTDTPVQHFAKIATPEIEGYTTEVKTVDSVAAHFGDADLEVNVPYTKVVVPETPTTPGTPDQSGTPTTPSTPEQPEVPSQPGTPQLPEQPVAPTARQANHAQPAANTATTATELPQTGDDSQHGATFAGLGLIGMMGALFGFKKKREPKN